MPKITIKSLHKIFKSSIIKKYSKKYPTTKRERGNNMVEGLYVTGIGMGVVFAFLCILVIAITLTDMIVAKYEKANPPAKMLNQPKAKKSIPEEEVIAVAIAAAIKHGELV